MSWNRKRVQERAGNQPALRSLWLQFHPSPRVANPLPGKQASREDT